MIPITIVFTGLETNKQNWGTPHCSRRLPFLFLWGAPIDDSHNHQKSNRLSDSWTHQNHRVVNSLSDMHIKGV